MRNEHRALRLAVMMVAGSILGSVGLTAQTTPDDVQQAIVRQLLSDDVAERQSGLTLAMRIRPADAREELRLALIALLNRQNRVVRYAREQQTPLDTMENPEFVVAVSHAVAALNEPRAIPALAGALGMGTVHRALTRFGEIAIDPVIAVVSDPGSDYNAMNDGLLVLRFLVERTAVSPLSPQATARIRLTAQECLNRKQQSFTTLWYAMDLAAVLDDADLRDTIELLVSYPAEIAARGVTNPDLMERTRRRAIDRLNGVPALPRPEF